MPLTQSSSVLWTTLRYHKISGPLMTSFSPEFRKSVALKFPYSAMYQLINAIPSKIGPVRVSAICVQQDVYY